MSDDDDVLPTVALVFCVNVAEMAGENAAAPTSSSDDTSVKRKHGLSAVIVEKMSAPVVILTSKESNKCVIGVCDSLTQT